MIRRFKFVCIALACIMRIFRPFLRDHRVTPSGNCFQGVQASSYPKLENGVILECFFKVIVKLIERMVNAELFVHMYV